MCFRHFCKLPTKGVIQITQRTKEKEGKRREINGRKITRRNMVQYIYKVNRWNIKWSINDLRQMPWYGILLTWLSCASQGTTILRPSWINAANPASVFRSEYRSQRDPMWAKWRGFSSTVGVHWRFNLSRISHWILWSVSEYVFLQ